MSSPDTNKAECKCGNKCECGKIGRESKDCKCVAFCKCLEENMKGCVGPTGPVGPEGPRGKRGHGGCPGKRGKPGHDGHRGRAGPAGATGATGPAGPAGSAGATGPAGPAGSAGATGPQGIPGLALGFGTRLQEVDNIGNANVTIASLSLPAGSFMLAASLLASTNDNMTAIPVITISTNSGRFLVTPVHTGESQDMSINDFFIGAIPTVVNLQARNNNGSSNLNIINVVFTATQVSSITVQP